MPSSAPDGFGIAGNEALGLILFLPVQIGDHCTKVKTEPLSIGVSNPTDFINDWIVRHSYSSMSSSGVQITGQA